LIAGLFLESNQIEQLQDANWTKLGLILAYQVLFLNLAFILWQRILSRNSMTNVTPYLLLYPLFGVIFGIILLDEPLTSQLITGGALVIAGAGLMTLRFKQKSDKTKQSDNNPDDPEIYVEKIT
jgi:O-acetylserine/cysteine efflux transporter